MGAGPSDTAPKTVRLVQYQGASLGVCPCQCTRATAINGIKPHPWTGLTCRREVRGNQRPCGRSERRTLCLAWLGHGSPLPLLLSTTLCRIYRSDTCRLLRSSHAHAWSRLLVRVQAYITSCHRVQSVLVTKMLRLAESVVGVVAHDSNDHTHTLAGGSRLAR